ncbi:hypothetical protein [Lactococcus formosensis]|uniref:HEPN AbiU2-like domain-containing protein n=1 Tax=Lactococcus formosensis TaxID=1281486 RepID=A0A9X4SGC4_9LACT|nr:hypothetical protein [Lactococcus formosensis]MDG6143223.1 hypothetical protein [Lactococcus formosensis]MDG6160271.1 hypothetical protein [Lactococcus formosensis]MDG6166474.1 hypothetical protein [Lactococcus formosensis]MDG6172975.1 hypothetical protein [Lactococcus formosensis]MDG6193626.1 hypothetical protein [Lactococcus formosensis]
MNPKIQIEKLKKDLEWLLYQAMVLKQTFNAALAVSQVFEKTDSLATYGDYFALTQNIIIGDSQLQLAKLFDKNKQSISIPKIIETANELYTEKYFQSMAYFSAQSYQDLKSELEALAHILNELEQPIKNLKKLRDKNLAHLDKSVDSLDKLINISNDAPVLLSEAVTLIDFSIQSLSKIKTIMFSIDSSFQEKDYVWELSEIAKAIEDYQKKVDKELE